MYKRIVGKGHLPYAYLKIKLEFEDGALEPEIEAAMFKYFITQAIQSLHGEIGASHSVDVLKFRKRHLEAILRVSCSFLSKLWSSLTLVGNYKGQVCAFRVQQVSSHLMALSSNSRELNVS
ncbi:ribonuclease P protein subunit RPP14 [Mytilus galloprovincialis]|uniref:Ribonuclease P protein subunit RPP14 n=1 Tax=Mytilus galloprovincialis TaxID=29158 RepID=A0A8B6G9Y4_MYTGA|nr:ribonuclease P protein subunit RPP14 [Mytilus galloprovincialis]